MISKLVIKAKIILIISLPFFLSIFIMIKILTVIFYLAIERILIFKNCHSYESWQKVMAQIILELCRS